MKGIIIDDERNLPEVKAMYNYWLMEMNNDIEWRIVRTYDEFKAALYEEMPDVISFDHDLKDFDNEGNERTGYTCAQYLCDFCLDNNKPLPKFVAHTGNPVGRGNIMNLLMQFNKYYGK